MCMKGIGFEMHRSKQYAVNEGGGTSNLDGT